MVGWRTAGAGRMEDGKERDPNQSSSKMDGVRRGRERRKARGGGSDCGFSRGGSAEKGAGRGEECKQERWFSRSCEEQMGGGPGSFWGPLPVLPAPHPASVVQ